MNSKSRKSVWVAIPARNCSHSIEELIHRIIALGLGLSIVVVDDFSEDDTFQRASKFDNVLVHRNKKVLGYGGTTTQLYKLAVAKGADFVVNIHGDLGHRPEDIVPLLEVLTNSKNHFVVGSRLVYLKQQLKSHGLRFFFESELRGNMSLLRLVGHFGLTFVQNLLFRQNFNSYHEGMRGCNREALEWILSQQMPSWYDYDSTLLVMAANENFSIKEIATPPHYDDQSTSSAPAFRYGFRVLRNSIRSSIYLRKSR